MLSLTGSLMRRKTAASREPERLCQTLNSALGTAARGEHPDQHLNRATCNFTEVFGFQRQAHAEHDQAGQRHYPFRQGQEEGGLVEGQHGEQQDPQSKGIAGESAEGSKRAWSFLVRIAVAPVFPN
ncbi:hypothetical protein J7302_15630 [Pseudomonas sp. DB1]|uniref:Uncharacterized protein n=1 Tax=Metapseudomonas boanensis TaxID=2822138 RepID=A0ABS5XJT8_9GAMM|nr:hypothetical protein [Pseudomonas boanensis]